jgi:hypothetical protein
MPQSVQDLADRNYSLLKNDPRHPSLHMEKASRCPGVILELTQRINSATRLKKYAGMGNINL